MLNLFGRVSMDTSGWTNALAKMKATAGPAGSQIGQQIRGKMLEAFGAAGAIALFKKSIANAMEITAGATKAGVDTGQFQVLKSVAEKAGLSVEQLTEIMAGGGEGADELSAAVELARQQMEQTGQLIGDETLKRLQELGDKLEELFGKFQPIIAKLIEWISWIPNLVDAAVAGAQIAYGQMTGQSHHVQAGREAARAAFNPEESRESNAARSAAEVAARVVREANREEGSGGGGASRVASAERAAQVSSLVASGAVWNVGAVTQNRTMQVMQNEVARIRAILERGRD